MLDVKRLAPRSGTPEVTTSIRNSHRACGGLNI